MMHTDLVTLICALVASIGVAILYTAVAAHALRDVGKIQDKKPDHVISKEFLEALRNAGARPELLKAIEKERRRSRK